MNKIKNEFYINNSIILITEYKQKIKTKNVKYLTDLLNN